jgi:hypothetical protein
VLAAPCDVAGKAAKRQAEPACEQDDGTADQEQQTDADEDSAEVVHDSSLGRIFVTAVTPM